MMKTFLLIFFFNLIFFNFSYQRLSYSQEEARLPVTGKFYETNSKLGKAADNEKLKKIYDECQTKHQKAADPVATCISNEMKQLSPQETKNITDQLGYDNPDSLDNIQFESSPVFKKFGEYLFKRFSEALYGKADKDKGEKEKLVDQKMYFNLYKTQLGKSVIQIIASYCMYADPDMVISATPATRQGQRNTNIKKLQSFNPDAPQSQFTDCMSKISHVCQGTKDLDASGAPIPSRDFSSSTWNGTQVQQDDEKYSRNLACIVERDLKNARNAMLAMKEIDKGLEKYDSNNDKRAYFEANREIYTGDSSKGEKTVDDLTSLTSNEFMNKAGMNKAMSDEAKMYDKKCVQSFDSEYCKGMSAADKKNFEKMEKEYKLRTEVMKHRIETMTPEELHKFLEKEGRTSDEVKAIIARGNKIGPDKLKERIAQQYEKERDAIISKMREKFETSDLSSNKNTSKGTSKTVEILNELKDRPAEIRDLIHYTNIVSGLLTVKDSKGRTSSNVQSALREVKDSFFNPSNAKTMGIDPSTINPVQKQNDAKYFEQLQKNTLQAAGKSQKKDGDASAVTMEVRELNKSILGNYLDTTPEDKKDTDKIQLHDENSKDQKTIPSQPPSQPQNPIPPPTKPSSSSKGGLSGSG
ncbi:MAG: hypothetical protein HQK51_08515, partial [Oligoflexia bacterium]|nr:hypothetical protein [Oligoflexia bacterium]